MTETGRLRLAFLGAGAFGLPTLQWLQRDHEVVAVVSQPDRPAGRKRHLTPTPIADWAASAGLEVVKSEDVNTEPFIARARQWQLDAAVVVAFGQKLSSRLIDSLGLLPVNLHASLLPKYRGAAPINWAIIHGERETGVTVIGLAQRMDAGLIYAAAATPIDPLETAGELHDRLSAMGPAVIAQVLDQFRAGRLQGRPQDESHATRAPKLSRADSIISFDHDATAIRCRIHGLTPWPGVKVKHHGRELTLRRVRDEPGFPHQAAPGTILADYHVAARRGAIRLLEVQPAGGKTMTIEPYAHGHPLTPGETLMASEV